MGEGAGVLVAYCLVPLEMSTTPILFVLEGSLCAGAAQAALCWLMSLMFGRAACQAATHRAILEESGSKKGSIAIQPEKEQ